MGRTVITRRGASSESTAARSLPPFQPKPPKSLASSRISTPVYSVLVPLTLYPVHRIHTSLYSITTSVLALPLLLPRTQKSTFSPNPSNFFLVALGMGQASTSASVPF